MDPISIITSASAKLLGFAINKALGVEVQGSTVRAWGEQFALGVFLSKGLIPEPTFEQQVERRFRNLQSQIDKIKNDIDDLKLEMNSFQWRVETNFLEDREEELWQNMLEIEQLSNSYYSLLSGLGNYRGTVENRASQAKDLANTILNNMRMTVPNARLYLLGEDVGAAGERVRGFLEIWQQLALRDAVLGWGGDRLEQIYHLLVSKFTRALLIQVKCARLVMEALEAQCQDGSSEVSAVDYFADEFYPVLVEEVKGFRNVVESLAINLLPLPKGPLGSLSIPGEIAGILASVDIFTARALCGQVSNGAASTEIQGRTLAGIPPLAGCWGRVIIPGWRWIQRAPGSKEAARVTITLPDGKTITCKGALEVRAIKCVAYPGEYGVASHHYYQLDIGNEPRAMGHMLLAQFIPSEILPPGVSGSLSAQVEDQGGICLAQAQVLALQIPFDGTDTSATVSYGAFTTGFTGGASMYRK